ncbi:MAG: fumarylacetoacetate hydrolase family protein [Rhizobiales bacterium]|nr:fumarylacetoacetate hydrolase family protein [Hyphomicrobiales bacterium]
MKLCRFGEDRLGLVEDNMVRDVSAALDVIPSQRWPIAIGDPLITNFDAVLEKIKQIAGAAEALPLDEVQLQCPVTNPSKIMAAPANYRKHVEIDVKDPGLDHGFHAKTLEGVERPVEKFGLFLKSNSSVIGPSESIKRILPDRRTDYEAELTVIIGKTCRSVSRDEAMDYIAGYTVGLDMSVRGTEDRSFRKSLDTYSVFGPWIVTADEIPDPAALEIWLEKNGEPQQRSSVGAMTVDIPDLIAFASAHYTLHPGDLIMTGTPEGVGPVVAGDVIKVGCSGIGQMTIPVI